MDVRQICSCGVAPLDSPLTGMVLLRVVSLDLYRRTKLGGLKVTPRRRGTMGLVMLLYLKNLLLLQRSTVHKLTWGLPVQVLYLDVHVDKCHKSWLSNTGQTDNLLQMKLIFSNAINFVNADSAD